MARLKRPPPVATMNPWHVLKRPHITEKTRATEQKNNAYTIEVDSKATKMDIREAVSRIWNVRVLTVRTIRVSGKEKVVRRKRGRPKLVCSPDWKKAIVKIAAGQSIESMR